MENYNNHPRHFKQTIRDVARTAVRHLTVQPLASHGDHLFEHPPTMAEQIHQAFVEVETEYPPMVDMLYVLGTAALDVDS